LTRILIIEDEKLIRENILETLGLYDYEVFGAVDGASGIQLAHQKAPDLILCDIMMPELDGYSVLEKLQSDPTTAMIPFVFLSALADKQSVRRGMDLGADDYITKPFTPQELVAAVQARLAKHASAVIYFKQQVEKQWATASDGNANSGDSQTLIGQNLRGYQIWEKIGEGGVGVVYKAYQAAISREVAVKVLRSKYVDNPEFIRRFETEAELVARLEHPHIVPLYDYWRGEDTAYLVMRWVRGGSLRTVIDRRGEWSLVQLAHLLDQVTDALSIAHQIGVIHRDLKPDNILLDERGNAYLTDFGLAKHLVDLPGSNMSNDVRLLLTEIERLQYAEEQGVTLHLTNANELVGSPGYLSPEQIVGDSASVQSDIYGLGVTLYELLVGERPFAGTLAEVLTQHLHNPIPSIHEQRPDLPEAIDEIIQTATAKDWRHRYPDAPSLAVDFRAKCT
jgi:CheY-like chemotaxis protein/tRNA A-37 threonylcarbamoyl transferase component Bud32